MEQLLCALPVHLLAVLLGRQVHGAAAAAQQSSGEDSAVKAEPGAMTLEVGDGLGDKSGSGIVRDGPASLELPAMYVKKGLVALSHLADLAARTPLAGRLEVRPTRP